MIKKLWCFIFGHKWRVYMTDYITKHVYEYWWEESDRCWRCDKPRETPPSTRSRQCGD